MRHGGAGVTDQRRLLTWLYGLLCVLAGAAVLWLAWLVLQALAPVVVVVGVGALLATLLGPVADGLQRRIRSRPLAALAVVLLLLAPFVAVAVWLATTVQREAQQLLAGLPQQLSYLDSLLVRWQESLNAAGLKIDLAGEASRIGTTVLQHALGVFAGIATVTTDAVLALIVAFFLILDGEAMAQALWRLLPARWLPAVRDVARILSGVVAEYVRGQFVVGAVFGVLVGVSMQLLGLPDAALLGFLAGLFELLPTVGPLLAGVGPVVLALEQPFPRVLWVLAVLVAAQQLESNVLVPRISGGAVGLHPLTVIIAVFAGWHLGGLGGALLAVPAVGVAREVLRRWWQPAIPAPRTGIWPARGAAARRAEGPSPGAEEGPAAGSGGLSPVRAEPPPPPAPTAKRGQRARQPGR
jgi:predicted PurR-regulated permease PerM